MHTGSTAERVLFEARVEPRYMLSAFWGVLAVSCITFGILLWPTYWIFYAVAPFALAIREWNRVALRVTESAIHHQQPGWMAGALTFARARAGLRIHARDVVDAEWIGHDNIGIRLNSGVVESVCFTHRIAAPRQASARAAIVEFIERATGRAASPAREVAAWAARPS